MVVMQRNTSNVTFCSMADDLSKCTQDDLLGHSQLLLTGVHLDDLTCWVQTKSVV